MIRKGSWGYTAELLFNLEKISDGSADSAHVWNDIGGGITDQLKIQLPTATPGTYSNATISQIVNRGGGTYGYQLNFLESANAGKVLYYPNVAGYFGNPLQPKYDEIVEVHVSSMEIGLISRNSLSQDVLDAMGEIRRGAVAGWTASTIQLDAGASSIDDYYKSLLIGIVQGPGTGQVRRISGYVGATQTATLSRNWNTNPNTFSRYVLLADESATATLAAGAINHSSFTQDALDLFREARRGTAQGGAVGSITLDAGASSTTDAYKFCEITIVSGTGAGQTRQGVGYNGGTKVLTVDTPWVVQPNATSVYELFYRASGGTPGDIATAVWATLLKGSYTATQYMNLIAGLLAGPSTDYTTGNIVFRNPFDTAKIVLTGTVDDTGRLTILIGNLN